MAIWGIFQQRQLARAKSLRQTLHVFFQKWKGGQQHGQGGVGKDSGEDEVRVGQVTQGHYMYYTHVVI